VIRRTTSSPGIARLACGQTPSTTLKPPGSAYGRRIPRGGRSEITITYNNDGGHEKIMQLVQSDLAVVGLKGKFDTADFPNTLKKYDMAISNRSQADRRLRSWTTSSRWS
jgi:hypothetical protein